MLPQKGGEHIAMESQQGGGMGEKRTETPHKCFRTYSCEICNPDFHYSYPDGQQSCPIVSLENGGGGYTHSLELLKISKSVWHYLLSHGIIITAEYLPTRLNVQADWESRNSRDPSGWKLHQSMFQSIIKYFGYLTMDLIQAVLSTSTICSMEARSKQQSNRCNVILLKTVN